MKCDKSKKKWDGYNFEGMNVLYYDSWSQVPSPAALQKLAEESKSVRIALPPALPEEEGAAWVATTQAALPDCHVWGGSKGDDHQWFGVQRVIAVDVVLRHADEFVEAAREFRRIATERVYRLAAHLSVSPMDISSLRFREFIPGQELDVPQSGIYDNNWRYGFHGFQCALRNEKSGQYLDVELGYGDDFGVLDPYFFAGFLKSTPAFKNLGELLPHDYMDGRQVLEVLERAGRLIRVPGASDFWSTRREPKLAAPRD